MIESVKYQIRFAEDPNKGKRNTSWVKLLPLGETIDYHGKAIELDEKYLSTVVRETRRLNAYFDTKARERNGEAYRQPVWREHQRSTERDGSVDDIKLTDKQGFHGVWVQLSRTDEAQEAIEADKIKYVSAGIVPEYTVESGETFGPVIREVSLTADPFLKSIGTIQDTIKVTLSQFATELDMELPQLEAFIDERIKAVFDAQAEDTPEDVEEDAVEASQSDVDDTEEEALEAGSEEVEEAQDVDATDPEADTEPVLQDAPEDPTPEAIEASQDAGAEEPLTLSAMRELIQPIRDEIEALKQQRSVRLNTRERGRQGDPATPELALSYEAKIKQIMRKHKVSRLEAVEMEMRG